MLHYSKTCNETKLSLGSRIPISKIKRNKSFRTNENGKRYSTSGEFSTTNVNNTVEIVQSEKGNMTANLELEQQRNIGVDVFDWLNKNSETSDKYSECCVENNTNLCTSAGELSGKANSENVVKNNGEDLGTAFERNAEMAKERTVTKSYFNVLKNAIFPFEGKYFYLSGELNNQKISLTETTKIVGDNPGHLVDKTSCNDDRYKEILGDKKGQSDTKTTNRKWEINGLKDKKVYHEDQRVNTDDKKECVAAYQYKFNKDNLTPLTINLKTDTYSDSQQKEIDRLRTQVEKLSTFVERSEERREQSEALLAQQKEELLKHIREKEVLDNRVCCLEELRSNLQRKVDEISDENKSLKFALKSNEDKLIEEQERVKVLKEECSTEIAKNVELELVLQTIREELGCENRDVPLGKSRHELRKDWGKGLDESDQNPHEKPGQKKVHWGDEQAKKIPKPSKIPPFNAEQELWGPTTKPPQPEAETSRPSKTQYSCLKQQPSEEALWKREKKQFEGKIMLLEMDKKKLRSHIDQLEERAAKQENIEQNLREVNEVLEFRILELEYELVEKTKKQ